MTRSFLILFLFLFCILSLNTSFAAVISRDWKTPGDGLLTLDTVNKREWLDLSQTLLSDQFPGSGANFLEVREARYQYVVGQTAQGGLFEEFTVAKSPDVIALAQSVGSGHIFPYEQIKASRTRALIALLGPTLVHYSERGIERIETMGLLDEIVIRQPRNFRVSAVFVVDNRQESGLQLGSRHVQSDVPPGVMLYRVVPEPSAVILVVSMLIFSQRLLRWVY